MIDPRTFTGSLLSATASGGSLRQDALAWAAGRLSRAEDTHQPGPVVPFDAAWLQSTAPSSWRWDWPFQLKLYDALNRVSNGSLRRLAIFWPPRHFKTETVSVRFPVHWLERAPWQNVILAAHTQRLANRFSRRARRVALGRLQLAGPQVGGARETVGRSATEEWETEQGGGFRAVGVGVGPHGLGAHLIVIDDPIRQRAEAESETYRERLWDWYTDDLYTRQEPGCAIILTMARWHEDDLAARILDSADGQHWEVLRFPAEAEPGDVLGRQPGEALCPERFPAAELQHTRQVLGSYAYAGLYQQRPAPLEGGLFKRIWWRFWAFPWMLRELPAVTLLLPDGTVHRAEVCGLPERCDGWAQSWDMAFKDVATSDFVVGQVWGRHGADMYLRDQVRQQLDFPATVKAVRALTRQYPLATAKWVEDKANGPAVIQSLRQEIGGLIAVEPEGGKQARAAAVSPLIESGNVYLPHPAMPGFGWVQELVERAAAFPSAAHDDEIDALSQALIRLRFVTTPDATRFGTVKATH